MNVAGAKQVYRALPDSGNVPTPLKRKIRPLRHNRQGRSGNLGGFGYSGQPPSPTNRNLSAEAFITQRLDVRRSSLHWFRPTIAAWPIAIDFGAKTLKVMQLIPGPPLRWHAAAWVDVPRDLTVDPATRRAFFAEQLPRLLKSRPFIGRPCLCSLPASDLLVQQFQLPANSNEPIEQAAANQLQQRLNVDVHRMVVRHWKVGEFSREGRMTQEIITMAASRQAVMGYLDLAARCRLDVLDLVAEPQAILWAFAPANRRQSDAQHVTLYLDLGQSSTKIVMALGSQMQFAKVVYLPSEKLSLNNPAKSPAGNETRESEAIDCLLDELHLSIRYVQAMLPQHPIDRIIFLGGKANDHALCQYLARNLNLAAQLGDPAAQIPRAPAGHCPEEWKDGQSLTSWSVALGLAQNNPVNIKASQSA